MTKKHFIALADAIKDHNALAADKDKFTDAHLDTLARFCFLQNGGFMGSRWRNYINGLCGRNGGTIK